MERLKELFKGWTSGVTYIADGEIISFYTYFSVVLSEIVFLWVAFQNLALPFTILGILSMLNILICAAFKGRYEGTKTEWIIARIYASVFLGIFIVGFFFNWLANIVLFSLPFILTGILSSLNEITDTIVIGEQSEIEKKIYKFFENPVVSVIARILVVALPFFVVALSIMTTHLTIAMKAAIIIGYGLIIPVFAYLEDELAACNIFEIVTSVIWSEEYERAEKELEKKLAENPEAFREDVLAVVKAMQIEKIEQMVDEKSEKE